MANVVNVYETWDSTGATLRQEDGWGNMSYNARRGYTVLFDAPAADNCIVARTASGIPAIGSAWSSSWLGILAVNITVTPLGLYLCLVVVDYAGGAAPASAPWKYHMGTERCDVEVSADIYGAAYTDPLGNPVIGVTRPIRERVYVITRNEASSANYRDETWLNKLNTAAVTLYGVSRPAGTVLLENVEGFLDIRGTSAFHVVTYNMRIRQAKWGIATADVWKRRRLCYGNYYWDGSSYNGDGTKKSFPCRAADGITNIPRKLRANGTLLPSNESDVFVYSDEYEAVAFSALGLN